MTGKKVQEIDDNQIYDENAISQYPTQSTEGLTLSDLKRLTKARAAQPIPKNEMIKLAGSPLPLLSVMSHDVTILDQDTGELVHGERVVLEIGEGRYLAFVSQAASEFAKLLLEYRPSGMFDEGEVTFRYFPVETRHSRRTYSFEVI
jgi:hypothetical protein